MSRSCETNRSINPKNGPSSSVEEARNGANLKENGPKKTLWTSEQDAILVEYVSKHGEGNWNAIQKQTGLPRCGNSCRLRWINHLRPNLKKGAITPEEEERIIKLQAKFGNRWARIVSEFPGRTDNEIKNFWNTRAKRRLRSGLTIYPPELFPELNQNQQKKDLGTFFPGNTQHHSFLRNNNFVVPTVEFGSLETAQPIYTSPLIHIPPNNIPTIPASNLLAQDLNSTFYPSNSLQQSESLFHGLGATVCDGFPGEIQFPTNASVQTTQSFALPAPWSAIPEWHDNLNGTSLMNLEVPSVQTQLSLDSFSSPLSSLETVDNLTFSHLTGNTEPLNLSPESYCLVESMLFNEAQTNSCPQTCNASVMPVHDVGTSSNNLHEIQPEASYGVPNSALGSSFPLVNEYTPIGGNLSDAPSQSINAVPGYKGKEVVVELVPPQYGESSEAANDTIFPSLDFLPEPNFFDPDSDFTYFPF